jgi:hypothetical protein
MPDEKYYAIVGGYTGEVIGYCPESAVADVAREEPKATLKEISREEFLRATGEDDADTREVSDTATTRGYAHPTTIEEFEGVYRREYEQELASCDEWIKWCENRKDTHGVNFYQGMRGALVFNDLKMRQLLRVLKQEAPNAKA